MKYITVIGLEIHAELLTKTKIFCSCKNVFGQEKNTNICPVCTAQPGSLPRLNKEAVKLAIKAGIVTDSKINNISSFDRKNYFYPDLPKGYQITQFYNPICVEGHVNLENKTIRIHQIHLEEDAGKLIHDEENNRTLIDYNRCSIPLIEIVTEPDFRTSSEVREFVLEIAKRLKYAGICDARLEEGSLRVDVNISVMEENSKVFGTRTEIKNLNSVKSIVSAIEYEKKRQIQILESGGKIEKDTLRYDEKSRKTIVMRQKEDANDYRYFPEPDILPLYVSDDVIDNIKKEIPSLAHERIKKYVEDFKLSSDDAKLLTNDKDFSDFFEEATAKNKLYRETARLMLGELSRIFNETNLDISSIGFSISDFSTLIEMEKNGKISKNDQKKILKIMSQSNKNPRQIAVENDLLLKDNTDEVYLIVRNLLLNMQDSITAYKNGDKKIFGYFMGQAVAVCPKGTNPQIIKKALEDILNDL